MKETFIAAAFLAVAATAQDSMSTRTSFYYYNSCSTIAPGIVTANITQTYCPPCEAAGMTTFPGNSLTTYVTQYDSACPTGLEEATYTVIEPCPSTGLARGPSYIPQGFIVTTVPCSVCEAGKSEYAQTTPGPALASALAAPVAAPAVPTPAAEAGKAAPSAAAAPASAPAAPAAPAGAASPANAENAAAAPGTAGSPAPAENGAAAPAGSPAGAGAASPANSENAAAAPGTAGSTAPAENGHAAPAGSPGGAPAPSPVPSQAGQVTAASVTPAPNGNSTVPFQGAANLISAVRISSLITALATLFTGFAFVL